MATKMTYLEFNMFLSEVDITNDVPKITGFMANGQIVFWLQSIFEGVDGNE